MPCFECGRPYSPTVGSFLFTDAKVFLCPDCQSRNQLKKGNELLAEHVALMKTSARSAPAVVQVPQMAEVLRPHLDAVIEGHRRAASGLEDISSGIDDLEGTVRKGTKATIERLDEAQYERRTQTKFARELVDMGHEQIGFSRRFEEQGDEMIELQEKLVDLSGYQAKLGLKQVEQGDLTNERLTNIVGLIGNQTGVLSGQLKNMGDILLDIGGGIRGLSNKVVIAQMEIVAQLRDIEESAQRAHKESLQKLMSLIGVAEQIADDLSDVKLSLRIPAKRRAEEAVDIALHELETGRFDNAQRKYEEAREADPRDYRIYLGLGWIGVHRGDKDVIDNFQEAKDRAKESGEAKGEAVAAVFLGRAFYSLEDYEKAAALLKEATEIDKDDLENWFRYAEYLWLSGKKNLAVRALWHLIKLDAKFILRIRSSLDLQGVWPILKGILDLLTEADKKYFFKAKNLFVLIQQCMEFDLEDGAMRVLKYWLEKDALQVLRSKILFDYRLRKSGKKIASIVEQVCCVLTSFQSIDYYKFAFAMFKLRCEKIAYELFSGGAKKDVYILRKDTLTMRQRLVEIGGQEFVSFLKKKCISGEYKWLAHSL